MTTQKPIKYSETVFLPKTDFPMKADLPKREPEFLSQWEKLDIYHKVLERNSTGKADKRFVLHDGPPYANGHLHMGHALNKILKDIIVKFKSSLGYYSPYVPGWDCHGLPIEHQLMKEKKWDKRKVGRVMFRQEATRYAENFVNIQRQEFKRLGVFADWDNPYKTLTPDYEAGIARTFYDLFEKGFIYREKKPVYWCLFDETALAEAEIEYADKTDASIFIKFPIQEWPNNETAQNVAKAAGKRVSVLVWTTTPWTLPANVALAFHPEQTYYLWESKSTNEKFIVGAPGLKVLEKKFGKESNTDTQISGLELEGLLCKNPLNNNASSGILAEFVSSEDGTGVVHIAPGHGQDDYIASREYGLPVQSPVDERGHFTPEVLPNSLAGMSVWEANKAIIQLLTASHMLVEEVAISHSYPHCWRCKNPILFRATEQWFLRVDDAFRKRLLEQVDRVEWIPEYGKERILGMLKTRPDWCVSRQRLWGAPIPMFFCEGCREPLKDEKVFSHVTDLFRKHGSNIWFEKDSAGLLPAGAKCAKCGKTGFKKEEDILDVWFDSGVSWVSVLRGRLSVTERKDVMYLEGSDQHRGWFQTSMLPSVALTGEPPYQKVLTHGFVVDGGGRKMSKSLGNVIAPQEILEKYGADVIRLWVAMSDYREDVRLSQEILNHVVDTYRKIRNTLRFLVGNLADFDPAKDAVPFEKMEAIDQEVLGYLDGIINDVKKHYDGSQFHLVSDSVCNDLCINALSGYYLDVQKDILYCDEQNSPRRRSAQTALLHIAKDLARMMAPMLSFTAEEVWQTLRAQNLLKASTDKEESVFLNPFPAPRGVKFPDGEPLAALMELKKAINLTLEKERQKGAVKGSNDAVVKYSGKPFAKSYSGKLTAYMGVSKFQIDAEDGKELSITVEKASGAKCERCWIVREDIGRDAEHPTVCARCAKAVRAQLSVTP